MKAGFVRLTNFEQTQLDPIGKELSLKCHFMWYKLQEFKPIRMDS